MAQRQQNISEPVPPFFIRTLVNLESSLNAAVSKEKEAKKKMNASNARALNGMKQKIKKVTKEYENEIKRYQEVFLPSSSHTLCSIIVGPRSVRARIHRFLHRRSAYYTQS